MRFYLASRYSRRGELKGYAACLRAAGHVVDVTWLSEATDNAVDAQPESYGVQAAQDDLRDVLAADAVVSFTEDPGGVTPGRARGGRHVEFSIGVAVGKTMFVIGPRENVFHYLPGVLVHATFAEFLRAAKYFK